MVAAAWVAMPGAAALAAMLAAALSAAMLVAAALAATHSARAGWAVELRSVQQGPAAQLLR
jgi:hypothetical protein